MPWRICSGPQCGRLLRDGERCPTCTRRKDTQRGSSHARGYTSSWHVRARRFRSAHPFCGDRPGGRPPVFSRCRDEGRYTLAEVVDHIEPHRGNPALFWDEDRNWQSLCYSCHARKTQAGL